MSPRDASSRKQDTLAQLATRAVDVWVATASADGTPYLVPLSLAWTGDRLVIAVEPSSRTARNLRAAATARLAVGPTRDVVMIEAAVERTVPVDEDDDLWAAYTRQADWDPRQGSGYQFVVFRPVRIQAWREADEMSGRTLMRDGIWSV